LNGYAHVEFASTEEALRAVRQGAPHGFLYKQRLLDIDFVPWVFYASPAYRVVDGTSLGGPRLMADLRCCSGHMTSLTVCTSCLPQNIYPRADTMPYDE
jgi:hypothetical protein